MKATFLIAASLIVGTAAIAQDTTAAPAPAPMDTAAPAPAPVDTAAPAPMTNASPPAETVAPAAPTDTSSYPPCSRTVQDRCVQTHEMARKSRPHR
jgi:hypothetical protein